MLQDHLKARGLDTTAIEGLDAGDGMSQNGFQVD
jgi:hypothetical protein